MSKRGYVVTLVLLGIGAMSVFLGNLLTIVAREWSFWCQRPLKTAQVWPSKMSHSAEVTSL